MKLRPYQSEGIQASLAAYDRGVHRQLGVLPTGTGKTILFSHLIQARPGRALVLAHRDRLIQQAFEKIRGVLPLQELGIVKAEQNRKHARCVIASVQTLARESRLRQMPTFDTVIIDEAHRAAAKIYRRIIGHVCDERTLLLGVTATPDRADGKGLDHVFDEIVFEMGLLEAIEQEYLCDLTAIQVQIDADFSQVHTKTNTDGINDYKAEEVCELMEAGNWFTHITNGWIEHARDRRTIAFVPRVKMAYRLAEHMRERGIRAAALDGASEIGTQRATVAQFEAGQIQVLVNCDLFVEGADIPSINCVLWARPTKSRVVYSQGIGRGTRQSPETGKTDCLILDMVGATNRLDLCTAASLIGARSLRPGESLLAAVKRERKEDQDRAEQQELLEEARRDAGGNLISEQVDLFGREKVRKHGFEWEVYREQKLAILRSAGKTFEIWKNGDEYEFADMGWRPVIQGRTPDYHEARKKCEQAAREILFGSQAKWRSKPASDKQINLMTKLRIYFPPGITAGEASNLIDQKLKRKAA